MMMVEVVVVVARVGGVQQQQKVTSLTGAPEEDAPLRRPGLVHLRSAHYQLRCLVTYYYSGVCEGSRSACVPPCLPHLTSTS